MMVQKNSNNRTFCAGANEPAARKSKRHWYSWIFPVGGLLAFAWFLLRVIPKPSRAAYPCQRAAFPLASGFVIWLAGAIGSVAAFRRARRCLAQSRYFLCAVLLIAGIGSVWLAQSLTTETIVFAEEPVANSPIGTAKGLHPGRVVWVHDPDATDWEGPGRGHWWESSYTNQAVVDEMMGGAIRALSGEATDAAAWDSLFKYFNKAHGKGGVGYKRGEKIVVKVGGKTLLYLIDGLYAGKHAKERAPRKWNMSPFNGDWTSSLFASQDPVAIDSVGFDFLWTEWDDAPHWSGTGDYLVEAALANDPPSGTFYDPDHQGNVTHLASLGVHERWNNPSDKQYSRTLGTGNGIELLKLTESAKTVSAAVYENAR